MTTFTQINARVKAIADVAKDSYARFHNTLGREEKLRPSLNILAKFRNFNIDYTPLKNILDKESSFTDTNIEELIQSMPQEEKEKSQILFKKILQSLSATEKEFNKLLRKMQDMEKLYTSKEYLLTQDVNQFTKLLEDISKINKPTHVLEYKENKEIENTYNAMNLSFENLQNLYKNSAKLLNKEGSHKKACIILNNALQQHKENAKKYDNLVLEQQQFTNNISQGKTLLSQLSKKLTSILDSLSTAGINTNYYKSELEKFHSQFNIDTTNINSSMHTRVLSNIKTVNEYIKKTIRKMQDKYQRELSKTIQNIENKANDTSVHLTKIRNLIDKATPYISNDICSQIEKQYSQYQQDVFNIRNSNLNSTDLLSSLSALENIDDLAKNIDNWQRLITKEMSSEITANCNQLKKTLINHIQQLQHNIDKKYYLNYTLKLSAALDEITSQKLSRTMPINDLVAVSKQLEGVKNKIVDIEVQYQSIKSSVDMILDGFHKQEGVKFLQAYLSIPQTHPEVIAEVLNIAMQKYDKKSFADTLAEVKFSILSYPAIQQIENFIKTYFNEGLDNIPNISYIKEKLYYYKQFDSLNEREKYISAIDNHELLAALKFLASKKIPITQAFSLINNNENKISVILNLQKHCNEQTDDNEAITAQEIGSILSSQNTIDAAQAIFRSLEWPETDDESYKNSVYKILMMNIASDDQFAQNIVNIEHNKELFTPNFLLYLCGYDQKLNSYQQSTNFFKEKLNSLNSYSYQVIIQNILQPNKYIDDDFTEFSTHTNNVMQQIYGLLKDNNNRSIYIEKLPAVFKAVNDLFNKLQEEVKENTGKLSRDTGNFLTKLELTKKLIFYELISDNSWENCVKNSIKVIEKNFADNPSFLEKIINGFKALIEKISNLLSANKEVAKKPINSKDITSRFRQEIAQHKPEQNNSNTNSI